VFIKEIVPKTAVTLVARCCYNENYVTLPMDSRVELPCPSNQMLGAVEYAWQVGSSRNILRAGFQGVAGQLAEGSEEQFITEHYWGYTAQKDGPGVAAFYGPTFRTALEGSPCSAFVADGSAVTVFRGERLKLHEEVFVR
jgi:uncharacterized protein